VTRRRTSPAELQDCPRKRRHALSTSRAAPQAIRRARGASSVHLRALNGRKGIADKGIRAASWRFLSKGQREEQQQLSMIVLRYQDGVYGAHSRARRQGVILRQRGISIKPARSMHEMKMDIVRRRGGDRRLVCRRLRSWSAHLTARGDSATEKWQVGPPSSPAEHHHPDNGQDGRGDNTEGRRGRLILATPRLRRAGRRQAVWNCSHADRRGDSRWVRPSRTDIDDRRPVGRRGRGARPSDGELAWPAPADTPEYKELTKGSVADSPTPPPSGKAGRSTAGLLHSEFVDASRVQLDSRGTGWEHGPRSTSSKGPDGGFGGSDSGGPGSHNSRQRNKRQNHRRPETYAARNLDGHSKRSKRRPSTRMPAILTRPAASRRMGGAAPSPAAGRGRRCRPSTGASAQSRRDDVGQPAASPGGLLRESRPPPTPARLEDDPNRRESRETGRRPGAIWAASSDRRAIQRRTRPKKRDRAKPRHGPPDETDSGALHRQPRLRALPVSRCHLPI